MGGPSSELVDKYINECRRWSDIRKVSDGVYISHIDMSLSDYMQAQKLVCSIRHISKQCHCAHMQQVGGIILNEGFIHLRQAFNMVSSDVSYTAERARRELLQIPVVSVRVGNPEKGMSFTILLEHCLGVDYSRMGLIINRMDVPSSPSHNLEKSCVQMLLNMAQSDRDRQCIKYAIYKASEISATKARHLYGFRNMNEQACKVENAMREEIANVKDRALLSSFGISEHTDSSEDEDADQLVRKDMPTLSTASIELCKSALVQSNYNTFSLIEALDGELGDDAPAIAEQFFQDIQSFGFSKQQLDLIMQSKEAYIASTLDAADSERIVCALNGCVVTDSEEETSHLFANASDSSCSAMQVLISKRRKSIQRLKRRKRAKALAEGRIILRKKSQRISTILSACPDIGKVMEDFVSEHNVGADSWRRTGVLTFDGNACLPQKVTYERIRQHLIKVYNRHFSYGSVVQLCVARNKRHLSSKRYHGVAKITTRRARKGFNLRYNPDAHWSSAFYRGLNDIQYTDGRDICLINRDDASGFRLDTLTTCKQYGLPTLIGSDVLTTRTDYVNKYPSNLQTTSYNFTASRTTEEVCVGVVKAPTSIHPKKTCQHAADLAMLTMEPELKPVFYLESGSPKSIDCIRVDGASDEGPSHEEVQFYWTQWHFLYNKVATLVTTRSSGSSYLNRVELQNGCLSRGHSGTFIPSTLAGSCIDPETGAINHAKLAKNMDLAVNAYISRVNNSPCGNTIIKLYHGADSKEQQEVRKKLLVFLKGSNARKKQLQSQDPELYDRFCLLWKIRNSHMIKGLPSYVFFLICCYDERCPHPRCQTGRPQFPLTWYPGGPPLYQLPLPFLDPGKPWGSNSCEKCKGDCCGHYKTMLVDVRDSHALSDAPKPPASVLKQLFSSNGGTIPESSIADIAKQVLLPCDECKIWLNHLQTVVQNRRHGAQKAAATRRAKTAKKKQTQAIAPLAGPSCESATSPQVNYLANGI